jgi:two-component system cell cycle sensor histidine kinase/response regulator CckA
MQNRKNLDEVQREIAALRLKVVELEKEKAGGGEAAEGYRDRLETLVEERTADLVKANELLLVEIAERKRMEEDLIRTEKLESLGVLAGGIAHDFNNLLSAVLGNISLARRYAAGGEKICERLDEAERAASRAAELSQQLLSFAKGGVTVRKIVSLQRLVRDAADFALRGSSVKCSFHIPDDLWAIDADEGQICQVISNIVLNAGQAMQAGGTVRVECSNERGARQDATGSSGDRLVRIDIKDQGTGIAKEHIERIFDPYFTTKQEGTGLGLATAYYIVRKHGGTITADSEPGKGTTFHIHLPAVSGEAADAGSQRRELFPGKGKVLVMDDEEIIRMIVGNMLGEIGYDAAFAEDGQEAVLKYRQAKAAGQPFDAVLLDLTIKGGMGGMECMRNLLESDPGVKAIVTSGYAEDPILSHYREFGFMDIITKPYQLEDLSEILFRVLNAAGR